MTWFTTLLKIFSKKSQKPADPTLAPKATDSPLISKNVPTSTLEPKKFKEPIGGFTKRQINQSFGVPWSANSQKQHTGLDIAASVGEEIMAIADGYVSKVGYLGKDSNGNDFGYYVGIYHHDKNLCSAYLHTATNKKQGDLVKGGDVIATVADLKNRTHLHFNTWSGVYDMKLTHRGALPSTHNAGKIDPVTDPAFPSNFIDPKSLDFENKT